jgi:altronate dehydratase
MFDKILHVASGRLCRAEILGFNDFAIKRIGPSM